MCAQLMELGANRKKDRSMLFCNKWQRRGQTATTPLLPNINAGITVANSPPTTPTTTGAMATTPGGYIQRGGVDQQQRDISIRIHNRPCRHRHDCKMESPPWHTTASKHASKQTMGAPLVAERRKKRRPISSTAPAPPSPPTRSLPPHCMENNTSPPNQQQYMGTQGGGIGLATTTPKYALGQRR